MATYKAEFLAHHYKGRLRPAAHYSMGWLPVAALLAARAPGLVNAAGRAPVLGRAIKQAGGIDRHRELPLFARERFTHWHAQRGSRPGGKRVILWPDTFTNSFHPAVGKAAVAVLEDAGFTVEVPARPVCCGLTWISTGQLGMARRMLARTIRVLRPALQAGTRVVVLEPSCAAVSRSTYSTAAAAGWPATSGSSAATTRFLPRGRSTGCGPRSGTPARRPRCSPTGSPAGPRSRRGTSAGRECTWPSCSRICSKPPPDRGR